MPRIKQFDAEIRRRYEAGENSTELSLAYGAAFGSICKSVVRAGGVMRSISDAKQKHTLNHAAFDAVTESSAYWVGFLMGDGCVHHRKGTGQTTVGVSLSAADESHVLSFRSFLGASHPLSRTRARNPSGTTSHKAGLVVTSRRLAESLAKYGVTPNKTHNARVIGLEMDRHFWRGLVDADGSLFVSRRSSGRCEPVLSVVGSDETTRQFAEFVEAETGRRVTARPHKTIHEARVSCWTAIEMIRRLYVGCEVALPRKLETARSILAEFDGRYLSARDQHPDGWMPPDSLTRNEWVEAFARFGFQREVAKQLGYTQSTVSKYAALHGVRAWSQEPL